MLEDFLTMLHQLVQQLKMVIIKLQNICLTKVQLIKEEKNFYLSSYVYNTFKNRSK